MAPELTPEQVQKLKSMNLYWEEISQREDKQHMVNHEIQQLVSTISPLDILLICGEYAKNYPSPELAK